MDLKLIHVSNMGALSPQQNRRHFVDDTWKCLVLTKKFCILIKMSLMCDLGDQF